jgi:magnesium-transporting ATPase (P-type)
MLSGAATLKKELEDAVRLKFPNAIFGQVSFTSLNFLCTFIITYVIFFMSFNANYYMDSSENVQNPINMTTETNLRVVLIIHTFHVVLESY